MAKEFKQSQRNREAYDALMQDAAGSVPPQAVELEEAVLGALMLENDLITTVQEYLTRDSFYTEEHRLIYQAIDELSQARKPTDLYTVTERLKSKHELTKVGGATYLAQLTQKVGSAANIEFHARIIAQKYVQRELIRSAVEIQRRSYDSAVDVTDLIDFAESEILKITDGHVKRSVQSASDILRRTMLQIEEAGKNDSKYSGICSGFASIDNVTLGWQPSDLIIVAARPSMGTLEMSAGQLMTRLIVAETGLPGTLIRSGKLSPEQWKHLEESVKPLGMAPLYIDDTPALSIFEFRSKARRMHSHNGVKLIIIDYLQLMTGPSDNKGNREQEVAFISRTLKAIAKELNVPIIALSQLNRSAEARGGSKRPQLNDLRESGAIEQDADIVAFIHRPEYYGFTQTEDGLPTAGLAEIIIAKHRNGAVTDIPMKFLKDQARFADMEGAGGDSPVAGEQYDDYASGSGDSSSSIRNVTSTEFDVPGSHQLSEVPF